MDTGVATVLRANDTVGSMFFGGTWGDHGRNYIAGSLCQWGSGTRAGSSLADYYVAMLDLPEEYAWAARRMVAPGEATRSSDDDPPDRRRRKTPHGGL
jgi:hypothetical protein